MNSKKIMSTIGAVVIAASMTLSGLPVCAAVTTMADGGKFDATYYAATYPDVVKAFGTDANLLYQHYKLFGAKEGRLPYAAGTNVATTTQTATTVGTTLTAAEKAAAVNILNKYLTGERFWDYSVTFAVPARQDWMQVQNPVFVIADLNKDGVKELWVGADGLGWNMNLLPSSGSPYWYDLSFIYGYDAATNTYLTKDDMATYVIDSNGEIVDSLSHGLTKKKMAVYKDIAQLANAQPLTLANVQALAK